MKLICRTLFAIPLIFLAPSLPAPTYVGDGFQHRGRLGVPCQNAIDFFGDFGLPESGTDFCEIELFIEDSKINFLVANAASGYYVAFGTWHNQCLAFYMNGISRTACTTDIDHMQVHGLGTFVSFVR